MKGILTNSTKAMQNIQDEINSMKAEVDASTKKRAKDFDQWKEVMLKQFKYEEAYGELTNLMNDNKNY